MISDHPFRLKYPIVLVHGLGAKNRFGPIQYFHGFETLLRQAGTDFFVADLPAWNSLQSRSTQLVSQINDRFPDETEKINLIGHSMGGLDCRIVAARPELRGRIASVTTVGTPNRGSPLGDLISAQVPGLVKSGLETILVPFGLSNQGLEQVGRAFCENQLPKLAPKMNGVAYFSATSRIANPVMLNSLPVFWASHRLLLRLEGENDGFVSVESSKLENHIITETGDHYAQIGHLFGKPRGLDYIAFYETIFRRLRNEGF